MLYQWQSTSNSSGRLQVENDPMELRRYTRDGDLIMLDKLLRRMPLAQINSSAPPDETSPIEKGWTALHYAAQANQLRALKKLMLYGAAAEAPTAMGETPLHVSLLEGRWKVSSCSHTCMACFYIYMCPILSCVGWCGHVAAISCSSLLGHAAYAAASRLLTGLSPQRAIETMPVA